MSNYNIEDEFRFFEDAAYRQERQENQELEPAMSDMEPHTFQTICSTDTIQRIGENEYRYTVKFLSEAEHDYSNIGGAAPQDVDKMIEKHELLQMFSSPLTFTYKTKWADFPEIQALACGHDL